jgi:hypothetical protein
VSNHEPTTSWVASIVDKVGSVGPFGVVALLITLGIVAFTSGAAPMTIIAVAVLIAIATVSIVLILGRSRADEVAGRPSGSPVEIDELTPGSAIAPGKREPSPPLDSASDVLDQRPGDPGESSDQGKE